MVYCVFCNSLVFYVSTFYFILWAVVSAGYSALLSSSYFERIFNDDDDDEDQGHVTKKSSVFPVSIGRLEQKCLQLERKSSGPPQ